MLERESESAIEKDRQKYEGRKGMKERDGESESEHERVCVRVRRDTEKKRGMEREREW